MTLADIAVDMLAQARRQVKSTRDLSGGLRIELVTAGGHHVLTLSRPAVRPSDDEISICRHHFHVPADVQPEQGDNHVTLRWPSGGAS